MREKSKKELILKAAAVVFAEKGFHPTTVEEIAIRAGVGKGTVYEYFTSKEELFREMLKTGIDVYLTKVQGLLREPGSGREILARIACAHFSFAVEQGGLARLLFEGQRGPSFWVRDWLKQVRERKLAVIAKIIARGISQGEFRPVDPRLAAEVFLGVLGALCFPLLLSWPAAEESAALASRRDNNVPGCDRGVVLATSSSGNGRGRGSGWLSESVRIEQGLDLFFSGLAST